MKLVILAVRHTVAAMRIGVDFVDHPRVDIEQRAGLGGVDDWRGESYSRPRLISRTIAACVDKILNHKIGVYLADHGIPTDCQLDYPHNAHHSDIELTRANNGRRENRVERDRYA